MNNITLDEKVALVTGSSRGIGKSICQLLAENGASVIVNYSASDKEGWETYTSLPSWNKHTCIKADVTNLADVNRMFDQIMARYDRIDILVNNAGWTKVLEFQNLEELTNEVIDKILNTNIKGVFYCSRRAVKEMKKTKIRLGNFWRGSIVNISSTAVKSNTASNIMYVASKAAVDSLTRTFAKNFGDIALINAVAPGLTRTKLIGELKESHFIDNAKLTPVGRNCEPNDIANVVLALVTQLTFVTGQILDVDGGRILRT